MSLNSTSVTLVVAALAAPSMPVSPAASFAQSSAAQTSSPASYLDDVSCRRYDANLILLSMSIIGMLIALTRFPVDTKAFVHVFWISTELHQWSFRHSAVNLVLRSTASLVAFLIGAKPTPRPGTFAAYLFPPSTKCLTGVSRLGIWRFLASSNVVVIALGAIAVAIEVGTDTLNDIVPGPRQCKARRPRTDEFMERQLCHRKIIYGLVMAFSLSVMLFL